MPANDAKPPETSSAGGGGPFVPPDLPMRMGAAVVGGVLLGLWRRRRRDTAPAAAAGVVLTGYALRSLASRALVAAGLARQRVQLHVTLDVDKPVHDVFTFFRDFENFPRLIRELHKVDDFQDGRSHWEIRGRGGELISWDAVVTKYLPNSVIAWQSVPGSAVRSNGTVRFSPLDSGRTHLDIALEYRPLHASLAGAVRAFLAPRPAKHIEAELARSPRYLEAMPPAPEARAD